MLQEDILFKFLLLPIICLSDVVLGNLVDVGDVERGSEAGMGKELVVEEAEDEFTPLTRHRREAVVRSNQKGGLGMVVHNSFETPQGWVRTPWCWHWSMIGDGGEQDDPLGETIRAHRECCHD